MVTTRAVKTMVKRALGWIAAAVGIAAAAPAAASTITYYHNDIAGSPVAATNSARLVIWRESYRPYGERLTKSASAKSNDVWFTSRREDSSGLVYMGARHYDPVAGRFVSTDPAPFTEKSIHSFNRYEYANDNPYRYNDPNGMWSTSVHHQIIDAAFSNWSSDERNALKAGSDHVDGLLNQLPFVGHSYEHAMRDPGQSAEDAERQMWQFVDSKIGEFRHYLYETGDQGAAWKALGEALHPIMDSTSPAHEGFQEWRLTPGTAEWHGDFRSSLESTISADDLGRTVNRINDVLQEKHVDH